MIIVLGHLTVDPADREKHIELSSEAVRLARSNPQCLDFSVSPDPLEPSRVNISERWTDRASLDAFRGDGPDEDGPPIVSFAIEEFEVTDPVSE